MNRPAVGIDTRLFIAGHRGMVGNAIVKTLRARGFANLITASRRELDLRDQAGVTHFFSEHKPECVILAAAKVGGINANMQQPADFLYDNLQIQDNIIHSSFLSGVQRFIFLGSSCIYPKECPQPMKEEHLLTGPLEPTNEGYALAKIVGLKLLQYYWRQYKFASISLMPCNLYGPNDSFDLTHSHVLSALVKRFVDAVAEERNCVTLWGTGRARREFMHVDDLARAVHDFMTGSEQHIDLLNVGSGSDISIADLAVLIARQTGFGGVIEWDRTKPDGMMRKCMDVSRMQAMGFSPTITLETGVEQMIQIYKTSRFL